MKNRIFSFIAACCLALSLFPARAYAAEPSDGEILYQKLVMIAELIKSDGLYSSKGDDPLKDFFIKLFNDNPDAFSQVADIMLKSHDSRSGYYEALDYDRSFPSQYSYVGIGIEIQAAENGIIISGVTPGSSAEQAGMCVGDLITHIDGKNVSDKTLTDIAALVRGEAGTEVEITVKRDGISKIFKVIRSLIGVSNFYYKIIEQGIAYMQFLKIDSISTYAQFRSAFNDMLKNKIGALILDLRGNPGGSLDLALNILQDFIPDEGIEFVSFKTRDDKQGIVTETSVGRGIPLNKIIVLVDGSSASASELIAGVLHDLGYAQTVGTKTYGKATGQEHLQLTDGSSVVLTILSIVLPSGKQYDKEGITPDFVVQNVYSKYKMPPMEPLNLNCEIYKNNYSNNTKALNQRLRELGFLDKTADYELMNFDEKTLSAIGRFQTSKGLKHTGYADRATLAALNKAMEELAQSSVLEDRQLEKAIELARTAVSNELPYTFDEYGDAIPKSKK